MQNAGLTPTGKCPVGYWWGADWIGIVARPDGDVPADAIRMRCEKYGKVEWIRASFELSSAAERQAGRLRRLAEVGMVRKVIWRDE